MSRRVSFPEDPVTETVIYGQRCVMIPSEFGMTKGIQNVETTYPGYLSKDEREIVTEEMRKTQRILTSDPHPCFLDKHTKPLPDGTRPYRNAIWAQITRGPVIWIKGIQCIDTCCRAFERGVPCKCETHFAVAIKAKWDEEKRCAKRTYFILTTDDEIRLNSIAEWIEQDEVEEIVVNIQPSPASLKSILRKPIPVFPMNPDAEPFYPATNL